MNTKSKRSSTRFPTFAAYARRYPPDVRKVLEQVRSTIKHAIPKARETISYNIPAFTLDDHVFMYFGAFKKHLGLFPPVRGDEALTRIVAPYAGPKGNLRFPYDQPIPYELIARIARFHARAGGPGKNG